MCSIYFSFDELSFLRATSSSWSFSSLSSRLINDLFLKQQPYVSRRYGNAFSESSTLKEDYADGDWKGLRSGALVSYFKSKAAPINVRLVSFILKLCQFRIDLTRQEDNEKYSGLNIAIHDAIDAAKQHRLLYCDKEETPANGCSYSESCLEKALSKLLEEEQKAGFELTKEDFDQFCCYRHRLYVLVLLGLQLDFLDGLDEMPKEHYHHRTLCEWIEIFLEEKIQSVVGVDKHSLTKDLLASIGFDSSSPAVESMMARSSAESTQHHIEACEWSQIFIKDEFKYNPLLSPLSVKFPFQCHLTNSWFFYPIPNIAREKGNNYEHICRVKIMNLVTKERSLSKIIQDTELSDFVSEDAEHTVLFHGTDHESAKNILADRGIYLFAGRQKRDFSSGMGFYLTKSADDALNWATSTTTKPAILIFKVNRRFLDEAKKLNLFDDEQKWREIVSNFRSARRTAKTRSSLSSYELIEGPLATVTRSETSDKLMVDPKPSSYQICLISCKFAESFQQTLHSVLFLDIQ